MKTIAPLGGLGVAILFLAACSVSQIGLAPQKQSSSSPSSGGTSSVQSMTVVNDSSRSQAVFIDGAGKRIDLSALDKTSGDTVRCVVATGFAIMPQTANSDAPSVKAIVVGDRNDGSAGIWAIGADEGVRLIADEQGGSNGDLSPHDGDGPENMHRHFGWVYHATAVSQDGRIVVGYAENPHGFSLGRLSIPAGTTVGIYWRVHRTPSGRLWVVSPPLVIGTFDAPKRHHDFGGHSRFPLPGFLAFLKVFFIGELQSYLIMATAVTYDPVQNAYVVTGTDQDGEAATATISKDGAIVIAATVSTPATAPTISASVTPASVTTSAGALSVYSSDVSVSMSDSADAGAVIHYTTDGTTPTATSPVYSSSFILSANGPTVTVSAISIAPGKTPSPVASQTVAFWASYGGFSYPQGVAIDPSGNIYIADTGNSRIVEMSSISGASFTAYGSSGTGDGQFNAPSDIALDTSGHLYITDQNNGRIVEINNISGTGWTSYGSRGSGIGQFLAPAGIAVDGSGRIFVADAVNNRITEMSSITGTGWTSYGTSGSAAGQFNLASGIAVDSSGNIYVADAGNNRIIEMSGISGAGWTAYGTYGSGAGQFNQPTGITVDSSGHIYVADTGNNRVVEMNSISGAGWTTYGAGGSGIGQFSQPYALAVDSSGGVDVADAGNGRIVRLTLP